MIHTIDFSTIDLFGRVSALGNHHKKHRYNIEKNFDALVSLIDARHLIDQFQLLRFSSQPTKEMKLITDFIKDRETLLEMLGCYYSLQFLLMNIKALDVFQMNLSSPSNRYDNYYRFLLRTGSDFRMLSGAYMSVLTDIFLPINNRPDFIVCCVGTRVDQDDIDLGIIDKGQGKRAIITKAFGALNNEMLKNASVLHFHLSEHVGKRGYSASIQEYHDLLDDEIQDFVILSEMLNAVPILGRLKLFHQFKREILDRYFYHPGQDNRYHEGCLRGLLGEIRDLIMMEASENILNPKQDALRMLKAIIFAIKTWKGIDRSTSLEVLDVLLKTDLANRDDYIRVQQALTFFETFRFLYQLFVVQEEEIYLEENFVPDNLQKVALAMGYEDKVFSPAYTQLLIHYQDHQQIARHGAENLIRQISKHLYNITIFAPITQSTVAEDSDEIPNINIAIEFVKTSGFFRGTRFWDDIFSILDRNDEILLDRFLKDFLSLPDKQMKSLVKTYVRWGRLSPYSLISLITIITKHRPHSAESDFIMGFLDEFMLRLESTQENISRLCHVLNFDPRMMNNFLVLLNEHHLEKLIAIIDHPIWKPDIRNIQKNLITLCKLYKNSAYYFQRFVHRVFNSNAAYILLLNNQSKFAQIADGLLRNLDNFETLSIRIDKLGDYYDFEFLRLGIRLINGESFEKVNKHFTIFSDNYIQILFDLCRELVSREMEYHIPETKDLLAVFAAGGHARSQSFDDDYDLIILLNSEDEEMLQFANKIILKMNKYIIQRSIMAHYRFADRFKNYVTTFQNLKEFFNNPNENAFIDRSQLLGARMIVGSAHFKDVFEREIIEPYIFKNNQDFTQSLKQEIASRHEYHADSDTVDIKESSGGLRDLENFLFILKARFAIVDPISPKLFKLLSQRLADYREVFAELDKNYYFLKHVRDLYRLIVSDNDELQIKYLNDIIEPLNQSRHTQFRSADDLHDKIVEYMQKNVQNINRIFSEIIPQ
ncbi:MAG: hypothetical protein H8D42_04305 [Candidatus Marinimicrobia bacterium]|nr:hypothetical protein [Candidatus Neomarinimicrobiota bacterium]MBL7067283.1 hypothetical protein [Candidatus Neomarinimicrobiota bacterium]